MYKRIIHINNNFPTDNYPNRARYVKTIDNLLRGAFKGEIKTVFLNSNYNNILQKTINYILFFYNIIFFKYKKNDIIFCHHFSSYLFPFYLLLLKKNKIIIHWHGSEVRHSNFKKRIIKKILKNNIIVLVHIFPSEFMKNKVEKIFNISLNNFIISPSGGIDVEIFYPKNKKLNETIKLGFASSLTKEKGVFFMIEALKKTNFKFELHYINYGKDKNIAQSLINNYFSSKKYDLMEKKELNDFYNAIDILIFPSFFESLGLVGLEAMACNKPVLATNDYGMKSYVKPLISGELFTEKNINDFVLKLNKILINYKKYKPRHEILKKYSYDSLLKQYYLFFNEL